MSNINIFTPGASATLAVTATSAAMTIPAGSGTVLRLINDGFQTLFFKTGATAAATDTPLLAQSVELFTLDPAATQLSAICATGNTATLRATRGQGV